MLTGLMDLRSEREERSATALIPRGCSDPVRSALPVGTCGRGYNPGGTNKAGHITLGRGVPSVLFRGDRAPCMPVRSQPRTAQRS